MQIWAKAMIKKILWVFIIGCVFLLPFLSQDAFKVETHFLYMVLSILLSGLAISTKAYLRDYNILAPLLAWLAIVFVTSIYSAYPQAALSEAPYFLFYAVVFIIVAGLDIGKKKQIALTLILSSFFISVWAILQYFFYFDKFIPYITMLDLSFTKKEFLYISDIAARQRVISVFVTPNLLAAYLAMINFIIIGFCFTRKNRWAVSLLSLLFIINCCAIWLTCSLSASASLIFGILLFFILFSMKDEQGNKSFSRWAPFLCIGVLILFAVLFTRRFLYESGTDSLSLSLQGRLEFWNAALRAIADRPLRFSGLNNFGFLYRIYAPYAKFESTMAHNLFLQLWIEVGVYGLLVFIWFLLMITRNAIRSIFKADTPFNFAVFQLCIFSALFAFLVHNMADFSFFVPQAAIIWWILCALLINNK
jgi:O-antigen ligase